MDAFEKASGKRVNRKFAPRRDGDLPEFYADAKKAKEYLPPRVAYYAALMGVTPTALKITSARTRYGSCSGKNSLCFSWRLMEYPTELVDYVIVHELAHIKHHDHSPAFYNFIGSVMPDHRERQRRLKYE